jgi:hypothetical protein
LREVLRWGRSTRPCFYSGRAEIFVFGGSFNSLVTRFAEDMSREFEMSMMGVLQFFLELQIK